MIVDNKNYISSQRGIEGRYGIFGSVSGNGCGAVSIYNLIIAMGKTPNWISIRNYLSKRTNLFLGVLGTSPLAVYLYIKRKLNLKVKTYFDVKKADAGKHDAYVVCLIGWRKGKRFLSHFYTGVVKSDNTIDVYNSNKNVTAISNTIDKGFYLLRVVWGVNFN